VGQIVVSPSYGRRFRVLANDVVFYVGEDPAPHGPYLELRALDDPQLTVLYPREWVETLGQQRPLFVS
jgi:hypothetical protein